MLQYLQERFGSVAFHDNAFHWVPEADRWSQTSPQHIDAVSLSRMFPNGFFDASFAIVRHPVSRLFSAFHFQKEVEKGVLSQELGFGEWLEMIPARQKETPFAYDNHIRPMDELVPKEAEVFRLEQGADRFIGWLDLVLGNTDGPRFLPKVNERSSRGKTGETVPTQEEINLIARMYARDFERFGYDPNSVQPRERTHEDAVQVQSPIRNILKSLGLS